MSGPPQVILTSPVASVVLPPILVSVPIPWRSHLLFLHIQPGTGVGIILKKGCLKYHGCKAEKEYNSLEVGSLCWKKYLWLP